ncbi:hypothetical protein QBC36DRAFT_305909 [Triangularia setosa]|uniref:Uncharacterized protein n=1 Tax=Triangularia setosa TaxID=2587417 RepID=A0AAN6WI59_9PEZI|nr:hypothetical protein QBC36DRAFT_305909 [Podospora setosa]
MSEVENTRAGRYLALVVFCDILFVFSGRGISIRATTEGGDTDHGTRTTHVAAIQDLKSSRAIINRHMLPFLQPTPVLPLHNTSPPPTYKTAALNAATATASKTKSGPVTISLTSTLTNSQFWSLDQIHCHPTPYLLPKTPPEPTPTS